MYKKEVAPSPKTFTMSGEKVKRKKSAEGRIKKSKAKSGEKVISVKALRMDTTARQTEGHMKKRKPKLEKGIISLEALPKNIKEKGTENQMKKRKSKLDENVGMEKVPKDTIKKRTEGHIKKHKEPVQKNAHVALVPEKTGEGPIKKRKNKTMEKGAHVKAIAVKTLKKQVGSQIKMAKIKSAQASSKIKVGPIGATNKNSQKESNKKTPSTKSRVTTSKKQATKQHQASSVTPTDTRKPLSKMQKKKTVKRAFKKRQQKAKRAGKVKKDRPPTARLFEPPADFDEDKFSAIVNVSNITKVAKGLKELVAKEMKERKDSTMFKDFRYFLNVSSFKIPNCPKHMVKLNLKHSLVRKDDDVVIVVPDLQRGAKVDYEPTIQHYEDLFREAGIKGLKVMPFNQLRNECNTFETVRKFASCYEYFLCDGRLVGHVAGFCGKIFQKPRTTFHAVRMENMKNLKSEIEKSLRRTAYKQLNKGDLISIPVGSDEHTEDELAENVEHVVSQLKKKYPGGWANIRGMHLKIDITGTTALPIYLSAGMQTAADTPYVVGPREQRLLKLKKVANEVLSKFSLTKDAKILKLTKTQVERKRKFVEMRDKLLLDTNATPVKENVDEDTKPERKKAKKSKTIASEEKDEQKATEEESSESAEEDNDDEDTAEEDNSAEGSNDDDDEEDSSEDM